MGAVRTALIVPAAGSGVRLGAGRQKALVEIDGRALVRIALECFVPVEHIVEAVVVAPRGAIPEIQSALKGMVWPGCILRVVAGGETRQDSVRCGIDTIESEVSLVCVHDAARPLVTEATILRVLAAAAEHGAATAASRPTDSLRLEREDGRTEAIERGKAWLVETPQVFDYELLKRAHKRAAATRFVGTDDASLVESCGGTSVAVVESDALNLKVTRPEDLEIVSLLLRHRSASESRARR
jgi:2-C-methyl-D-erythritol 4-phosphate cytidylyltransferase